MQVSNLSNSSCMVTALRRANHIDTKAISQARTKMTHDNSMTGSISARPLAFKNSSPIRYRLHPMTSPHGTLATELERPLGTLAQNQCHKMAWCETPNIYQLCSENLPISAANVHHNPEVAITQWLFHMVLKFGMTKKQLERLDGQCLQILAGQGNHLQIQP